MYDFIFKETHTNDAGCKRDIKSRIAMAKAAFHKKAALFTSKLKSYLRNQLVKCYIWSIALCGAGTWTHREVDKEYAGNFQMWCSRRMEKISVRNEEL